MANPTLLTMPMCVNADKNTIPPTDAGTSGLFSEELGFQDINSLPLASGGKAPNRRDFNGVFALLGGIAYACQRGFTFEWSEDLDYVVGCVVIDSTDGKRYECIADVSANATPPSADTTHWKEFGADMTVLANTDLSNLTATGLNAFATKTLSNLDTSNLTYHLVVESYYNDITGDWYRVYDDGWVEQGGIVASENAYNKQVNFLKPFNDTKYTITTGSELGSAYSINSQPAAINHIVAYSAIISTYSSTGFAFAYPYQGGEVSWVAHGMGALV